MSPSTQPVRNITVKVPRHNSQRIGPVVTAQVETFAREGKVRVDVRQTAYEPSSALAQAIESASEWNSLLLTARAERGPQWDIGTQQFLVEEYSELYYDPSPLLEYQKEGKSPADGDGGASTSQSASNDRQMSDLPGTPKSQPSRTHNSSIAPHHVPQQFFANQGTPNMGSPRHPFPPSAQGMGPPGMGLGNMGGMGMGAVPPGQFYGNNADSPMRMNNAGMAQTMGGMNMNMSGMGMGMGMHGGPDMGMGMGMNSPDPRRRMTRAMSGEDGFGPMHG
ncbi:uncharacterized protein B0H18DRAFT_878832 [Fomitopsis serialis]|uniref:uncharacterized protein n=1 Tax=Fomitopsis serialis TaxID=139415 RepID=UPI0020079D8A|nr:uncharacterized protein B0H18DRAFT_1123347 [Neoantrodia serialis]XP_047891852.1 uncharacterized protein B0H18DRAFT_878832 [Neoantrodia serialis]KAH9917816.1 hypothetical protein B0H18DRAFT_1123347 [Neoantrodia serialis]KAH9923281.1 hypothetical protein B0H18DRAFT_878832 [Neoantrodia serialis]